MHFFHAKALFLAMNKLPKATSSNAKALFAYKLVPCSWLSSGALEAWRLRLLLRLFQAMNELPKYTTFNVNALFLDTNELPQSTYSNAKSLFLVKKEQPKCISSTLRLYFSK